MARPRRPSIDHFVAWAASYDPRPTGYLQEARCHLGRKPFGRDVAIYAVGPGAELVSGP